MTKKKVCVVTGSRAEYGLLYWVMKELAQEQTFELQIIVTGMHLSPEFGLTWQEIERDGFPIHAKVEMLLSSDTPVGVTQSLGLGVIGFAGALHRLKPDVLVLLGDRFEILAAAQAALIAKIPVAHIAGGDVTEGAMDEAIRHSITKMSHLHFVTNAPAKERVLRMGENPNHVFYVGSPGLDYIKKAKLLDRNRLAQELEFELREKNFLVTFHPVTLESVSAQTQCLELLKALDSFNEHVGIIFTKPNADTDGRGISSLIDDYVASRNFTKAFTSLGPLKYLSLMSQVDVVIGNSSSGLYEAPSFKKPTVNIGDRQKGRIEASSVVSCGNREQDIKSAINQALEMDCSETINPYGDGNASVKIVEQLKKVSDFSSLLKKSFY